MERGEKRERLAIFIIVGESANLNQRNSLKMTFGIQRSHSAPNQKLFLYTEQEIGWWLPSLAAGCKSLLKQKKVEQKIRMISKREQNRPTEKSSSPPERRMEETEKKDEIVKQKDHRGRLSADVSRVAGGGRCTDAFKNE